MALVFSLSSALLAILVQQWVRDYMHVFQKYSDPLKAARLRRYLHDGCENWYMPALAEAVPGLLHVSLFLFFVGLGDAVLHINIAIGVSTVVPIGISGVFYIFTTFAPVFYSVTIPELILWPDLVSFPEAVRADIQEPEL